MNLSKIESKYYILLVIVIILILFNITTLFKELFRKQYNKLDSIYDTMKE